MKIPKELSFSQAASIPEVWLTAFQLLFVVASVSKGNRVLIHAAASGVGCAAIQLAKDAGAFVTTTASTEEKIAFTKSLGADDGIVIPRGAEWSTETKFDVILDCVGASYASSNLEALNTDGTWVLYSLLSGGDLSGGDLPSKLLPKLLGKRGNLKATLLRGRSVTYKADLVKRFTKAGCVDKIANGTFRLVIDKVFSGLAQAQAAHDYMESNVNTGKIVIDLIPDDDLQSCS